MSCSIRRLTVIKLNNIIVQVDEVVSAEVLEEKCGGQLCIIAFLPDIRDSGKKGRNGYLELMTKMGERFKKQKWGWGWASALAQEKLEKALQVGGFGYPVIINASFSEWLVVEFCAFVVARQWLP